MPKARDKAARFPAALDKKSLEGIDTLTDFDDRVTARLHGFQGAADYYARSSSGPFLPRVRVPLLSDRRRGRSVHPRRGAPRDLVRSSAHVRLEVSPRGGHVGFLAGSIFAPVAWAERRAGEFLAAVLAGTRSA